MSAKTSVDQSIQQLPAPAVTPSGSANLNLWQRLTEPSAAVVEAEQRRRARLLAALLFVFMILGASAVVLTQPILSPAGQAFQSPFFYIAMAGTAVVIIAYILSRSRYFQVGAALLLLIISGVSIAGVVIDRASVGLLFYLTLSVLLASMLVSTMATAVTAALNFIAGVAIPLLSGLYAVPEILPYVTPLLIMSVLLIVFSSIRRQDLAQIEQQTRDLAKAVEQARAADQVKTQFLATMSHELRTPLNAIIGFSEVMLMGLAGEMPDQARHSVDRIHTNSEWLLKLIDDILDISRIEAGRVDLQRSLIEPAELLGEIAQNMRPRAVEKGIALTTDIDPSLPTRLIGDPQRLNQVITNLTDNALKFTDAGGVTITFKQPRPSEWAIVVADTGIGIPPHAQEFIFEKFRQVDGTSRRAYKGSGLGLAIVKELCLLMGGTVRVNSEPGHGSTFTVTLPLVEPERTRG